MLVLTKEQRRALKRVYDRGPIYTLQFPNRQQLTHSKVAFSYLNFRRTVQFAYKGECAMVFWNGMWLGIEPDGYTHS